MKAFIECQSSSEFAEFFNTPADFACSIISIVMLVAIIGLPARIFWLMTKNKKNFQQIEFQEEHMWLLKGLRVDRY
jgi:hypothetical protein